MSGGGISWVVCKPAPHSRQIIMPAPTTQVFLQTGCPSCRPTNSVKALKGTRRVQKMSGLSVAADAVQAVLSGRGEREDVWGHRRDAEVGGADSGLCRAYVRLAPHRRRAKQFHYTTWPDHGVPLRASPIIAFRRVRSYDDSHPGIIIVYCRSRPLWPYVILFLFSHINVGWLSSRVVSMLVSGTVAPGFKSQSQRCLRQTVHTHHASVHQAAKLVADLLRVVGVTAGLAESNGSLPPGLWLTSRQADCQEPGSAPEPNAR